MNTRVGTDFVDESAVCILCRRQDLQWVWKSPSFEESGVYLCRQCEFAMTHPVPNYERLNTFYHRDYYEQTQSGKLSDGFLASCDRRASSQFRFMRSLLPRTANEKAQALEIGCNAGSLLLLLAQENFSVCGYESDPRMASLAQERLPTGSHQVKDEFFEADSWTGGICQVICSSHVFEHLGQPVLHLEKVRKMLDVNGILFMEVPNEWGIGVRKCLDLATNPACKAQGHLYYYSPRSLARILDLCDFEVLTMQTCGLNAKAYFKHAQNRREDWRVHLLSSIQKALGRKQETLPYESPASDLDAWMDYYWKEPEQGIWIRVVATPRKKD